MSEPVNGRRPSRWPRCLSRTAGSARQQRSAAPSSFAPLTGAIGPSRHPSRRRTSQPPWAAPSPTLPPPPWAPRAAAPLRSQRTSQAAARRPRRRPSLSTQRRLAGASCSTRLRVRTTRQELSWHARISEARASRQRRLDARRGSWVCSRLRSQACFRPSRFGCPPATHRRRRLCSRCRTSQRTGKTSPDTPRRRRRLRHRPTPHPSPPAHSSLTAPGRSTGQPPGRRGLCGGTGARRD